MTTASLEQHDSSHRPVGWAWLLFALFCVALAVMLGVLTTDPCTGSECSTAIAGGPVGWVAISALLTQAVWASIRSLRPVED